MLRNFCVSLLVFALSGCGLGTSEEIQQGLERARGLLAAGSPSEADSALLEVISLDPANVEAIFLRGRALEAQEQWVEAYAHFRRAASIEPTKHQYGLAAVALELRAQRWDDGLTRLQGLESNGLAEAQFNLWRARIAAGQGDVAMAHELYASLVDGATADVEILAEAAQVAVRVPGQQDRVRELLARVFDKDPGNSLARLVVARLHLGAGDERQGIAALREAVAADDASVGTRLLLASLEFQRGEVDSARRRYEHLAAQSPFDETAVLAYGEFLARVGELDKLRTFVARIEPRSPGLEGVRSYLHALSLVDGGSLAEALVAFDSAVLLLPNQAGPWLSLGRAALKNGELNRAENALTRALELAPGLVPAELELARIEMLRLDPRAALQRLHGIHQAGPMADEVGLALSEAELLMRETTRALGRSERALARPELPDTTRGQWERIRARALEVASRPEEAAALYRSMLQRSPDNTFAKIQLARLAGEFSEEKLTALLATELDAGKSDALIALGVSKLRNGRLDQARDHFQAALERDKNSYEANLYLGLIALERNATEVAKSYFLAVLRIAPGDPLANQSLGKIAQADDDLDVAQEHYERALRAERKLASSHAGMAEVLLDKGEVFAALRSAKSAVAIAPNSPRARYLLTSALFAAGTHEQALLVADKLVDDLPDFALGWVIRGRIARTVNNLDKTASSFREALKRSPRLADALIGLVEALSARGEFDAAAKVLETRLVERPSDGLLLRLLGSVQLNRGDASVAMQTFARALSLEPANAATAVLLARAASAAGDDERAARVLRSVLERAETPEVVPLMLGMILERLSRPEEAIDAYRAALAKAPEQGAALNNLAWLLHTRMKQPEEALRLARRAYLVHPGSASIADTLGKILIDQGLVDEAYRTLRDAMTRAPQARDLAFRFAQAAEANGRTEEALTFVQQALADPTPWPQRSAAERFASSVSVTN